METVFKGSSRGLCLMVDGESVEEYDTSPYRSMVAVTASFT